MIHRVEKSVNNNKNKYGQDDGISGWNHGKNNMIMFKHVKENVNMRREIEDLKMETLEFRWKVKSLKWKFHWMVLTEKISERPENLRFSDTIYEKWYTERKSKLKKLIGSQWPVGKYQAI